MTDLEVESRLAAQEWRCAYAHPPGPDGLDNSATIAPGDPLGVAGP